MRSVYREFVVCALWLSKKLREIDMRFVALILSGFILASSVAVAQSLEIKQAKQIVHMQERLGLTQDQIDKIYELDGQGATVEDIRSVLTQDQIVILQEKRKKQKQAKKKRRDRLAAMQKEVGLSDSQMEEIRQINARPGRQDEILALLTDEQKDRMKQFRKEYKSEKGGRGNCIPGLIVALELTPEQIEKIRISVEQGKGREELLAIIESK